MNIRTVLAGTIYPSNIGSAARAIANMGGDSLRLVSPQCHIGTKARQAAAGAQPVLQNRIQYDNWNDFYAKEGAGIRIGMTCRPGKNRKLYKLRDVVKQQASRLANENLYLIFGPEDNGLSTDDLKYVNYCCELDTFGEFKSMNLASAVLIALHTVQVTLAESAPGEPEEAPLKFPDQTIKDWITAMGFEIEARRASAYLTVKRLLLESCPTENEVMVLEAVLQQNIRKLNENGWGVDTVSK